MGNKKDNNNNKGYIYSCYIYSPMFSLCIYDVINNITLYQTCRR